MKYAISILATNKYRDERYNTLDEAMAVYNNLEDQEKYGVAEVHSAEEIKKMNEDSKAKEEK